MYRQDPRSMQRRARRRLVPFGEERRCRVLLLRELLTGAVLEVNGQSLRRGRHFLIINVHDADQTTSGTEMWINYQTGATDASSPLLTHGIRCHEADPRSTPQASTRCSFAFGWKGSVVLLAMSLDCRSCSAKAMERCRGRVAETRHFFPFLSDLHADIALTTKI